MLTTIIGRGHSGTRAMSHTLNASGVYMGAPQNASGDLLPPEKMYEACRILAGHVTWKGGLEWDFEKVHRMPIPRAFRTLIREYLADVLKNRFDRRGWKIPETTLVYPWIVRLFPQIHYVFWIRDPRDCILGHHITDDLSRWGIACPPASDERMSRAFSWKYQYDLVRSTPKPAKWIEIRFEDFVLDQKRTLARLRRFYGFPLAAIPVKPDAVYRWKRADGFSDYPFFADALRRHRYEPSTAVPPPNRRTAAGSRRKEAAA